MDGFQTLLILIAGTVGYFLPALVAARRKHHQDKAILMLNLLLGWTGLGWIAAFVWAVSAVRKEPKNPDC